jgi:protein phosphatase-4 regulatory subunit 3
VQGKDPSVDITQDTVEESEDERFDDTSDSAPVELPPCELGRLEEITEVSKTNNISFLLIRIRK